jgi:hypothetical protein
MNVYCALSFIVIKPKWSEKSRSKRRSNRLYGVFCGVRANTVTISYRRRTWIMYQDKTTYIQCNLTARIEIVYLRRRHFGRVDYPQISESIIRMKYIVHTLFC